MHAEHSETYFELHNIHFIEYLYLWKKAIEIQCETISSTHPYMPSSGPPALPYFPFKRGNHLPDYMMSQPRRLHYKSSLS
jgi:hypothetical protein